MGNPAVPTPQALIDPQHFWSAYELIARCAQSLGVLEQWAINQQVKDDIDEIIPLLSTGWLELHRKNRRFNRIWCTASTPVFIDNLTGSTTITLAVGWNDLNLAEGARIQLQSAGPTTVLYRCSDTAQSGVLV